MQQSISQKCRLGKLKTKKMSKNKLRKWLFNIALSIDQLGNAVMGGNADETISSRLGKLKLKHGGKISWRRPIAKIIDWFLDKIDSGHSIDAIEEDEGKNAVINFNDIIK